MSTPEKSKLTSRIFLYLTGLLAVIIPFLPFRPVLVLLFAVIYYFAVIIILNPKLGLLLLIVIRPCFDILTNEYLFSVGSFSFNFASLLGLVTLAAAALAVLLHFNKIGRLPLKLPWLILLAIVFVSVIFSFDRTASLVEALRLLSLSAVYALGFLLVESREDLKKIILAVIFSAVVPGLFAFYQFFTQTGVSVPLEGIYNRIYGTFGHPNLFAYYLAIPIILSLYLIFAGEKNKISRLLAFLLLPFLVVLLALTFTRGAWLAALSAVLIVGAAKYKKLFFAGLAVMALAFLLITPIRERVRDLVENPDNSISWRLALWSDAAAYVKEKPLLGFGAGTAKELILERRGEQAGSSDPHNDYLKIALENGMIGLAAYGLLIIMLFYILLKNYFAARDGGLKILILALIALAVPLYGLSLFDNILRNTALQWSFWALLGAALAANKKVETPSKTL